MNIRFFKASILAIALFSAFSAYAPDVLWVNNTNQDFTYTDSRGIQTIGKNTQEFTRVYDWLANPEISEFTKILTVLLSGPIWGFNIKFFTDNSYSQTKVIVDAPNAKISETFDTSETGLEGLFFKIAIDNNKEVSVKLMDRQKGEIQPIEIR
jgi:hypothetical protein